ncbi:MAG TPA: transposase [Ktedonobacteraceae bacterium]|nr:transposase [Ktedonobacteraceae bacterium]
MSTKQHDPSSQASDEKKPRRKKTPTFQVELPVEVSEQQAKSLHTNFEAARQVYNAILSLGLQRLQRMRADPGWNQARASPRTWKAERKEAFAALREKHDFTDYALQEAAKRLRVGHLAEHIEAVVCQVLATRAYRSLQRMALGQAKRVRFKSRGRGLGSVENKRNDTGLRFAFGELPFQTIDTHPLLQTASPSPGAQKRTRRARNQRQRQECQRGGQRSAGFVFWQGLQLRVRIDWRDPVMAHALACRVKYIRLIQRKASSPRAKGTETCGLCYAVQLVVEGVPLHKPKHLVGHDMVGADLGPSTIAIVPREGDARLDVFCADLSPKAEHRKAIRRLQRKVDRQRRVANPQNYDEQGRIKKASKKQPLHWKKSRGEARTRQRLATKERQRAAHRKSLHGRLVHEITAVGNTIILEKMSYKAWQKHFGRSVNERAPGMFVAHLRRTVARTGGTLVEVSTRTTKLSQFCHGCGAHVKKPLSERMHACSCGIGPIQRDLYSAFLAAYLDVSDPDHPLPPSCARYVVPWESGEARLRAAHESVLQRVREGQILPRSMSVPRARTRRLESQSDPPLEPAFVFHHERLEAWSGS